MNAVLFSKSRIGLAVPPVVPTELPGSAAWTLRIETKDGVK